MLPRLLRSLPGLQRLPRAFSVRSPAPPDGRPNLQGTTDLYEDPEPEEELEALFKEATQRQKTVKFHRLRRQLTPPGPPARRLTWDAIEQIRYLKEEFPEEWTVERLAEGFSVSRDVILRVLRSRFTPALETRARQDARVLAVMGTRPLLPGHQVGRDGVALLGGATAALGPPSKGVLKALPSGKQTDGPSITAMVPLHRGTGSPISPSLRPSESPSHQNSRQTPQGTGGQTEGQAEEEEEEEEDCWNGCVLSEQELEELVETFPEQDAAVVRKADEFYDSKGNFLYRL
ncbi:neugrin [Brienomyrus brachyistius]|uniref:neugrin n=1 Tax=Brienomyrus brachyistius TaxID=42636 RepID=UPI0020B446A6|nr:neugrin [Brienomyrus brachyistius]XP_048858993.1 neugrin [Brienomyrus brachyistius]XP_048858994.1 neugrin [Brienomyrus brachyistius]XP_048858995.1 neugrin [Brienomyrus brachyistius]